MGLAPPAGDAAAAQDDVPAPLGATNAALISLSIALFLALSVAAGRVVWRRPSRDADAPSAAKQDAPATTSSAAAGARQGAALGGRHAPMASATSASSAASSPLAPAEPSDDGAALSIGVEMRRRLFRLMLAAALLRAGSLAAELATVSAVARLPPSAPSRRLLAAALWLPSLLFMTLFGVVLLFWAQLCHACGGSASSWPRRVFFAANLLLYAAFAALVALARAAGDVWRVCDLAQSALYLAGLVLMARYGLQLVRFFRLQSADDDCLAGDFGSASRGWVVTRRQAALRRIAGVCILLCLLFATKAVYLAVLGSGYLRSEQAQYRTPVGVSHVASEFVLHVATELAPCALLLFLMRSSGGRALPSSAPRSDRTLSISSVGASSLPRDAGSDFLPARTNPSALRGFGGYAAPGGASAASAGRHAPQPEEAMAMLNPYHHHQPIRPGYGSVSTSAGPGRVGVRGDGFALQPRSVVNGGAAAGRRDYAADYRRNNM